MSLHHFSGSTETQMQILQNPERIEELTKAIPMRQHALPYSW